MNGWRWVQSCPTNMNWRTGSASAGERSGKRLKLLGYEAINGLAMMAVSTLVFGVLKLAG